MTHTTAQLEALPAIKWPSVILCGDDWRMVSVRDAVTAYAKGRTIVTDGDGWQLQR